MRELQQAVLAKVGDAPDDRVVEVGLVHGCENKWLAAPGSRQMVVFGPRARPPHRVLVRHILPRMTLCVNNDFSQAVMSWRGGRTRPRLFQAGS